MHITRLDRTLTGYANHATRQFAVGEVDATAAAVAQKWTSSRLIRRCSGCGAESAAGRRCALALFRRSFN